MRERNDFLIAFLIVVSLVLIYLLLDARQQPEITITEAINVTINDTEPNFIYVFVPTNQGEKGFVIFEPGLTAERID